MSRPSTTEGNSGLEQLRARARLYRHLAETLYDPQIVAVVLACASECEAQAGALTSDQGESSNGGEDS